MKKGYILYNFIYKNYPEQVTPQKQNSNGCVPGARRGDSREKQMDKGFYFGMMGMLWNQTVWLHNTENVLNATDCSL